LSTNQETRLQEIESLPEAFVHVMDIPVVEAVVVEAVVVEAVAVAEDDVEKAVQSTSKTVTITF